MQTLNRFRQPSSKLFKCTHRKILGKNDWKIWNETRAEGKNRRTHEKLMAYLFWRLYVGIVVMAEVIIGRGRKVRIEALSMDTKHNLYEHSERYRPILNRMYYREEQDDIEWHWGKDLVWENMKLAKGKSYQYVILISFR